MVELARTRDERLARRSTGRGPLREFLTFVLGADVFGVELARVKEILSPPPITPVPRAPREVVGVCSVRGLLVTVVDLRIRLKLEVRPDTRRTRILLAIATSGEPVGLWVDEVLQVVRLAEGDMELATAGVGTEVSEYVLGVGRPQGEFIVLLDLAALVTG
ncbi:MAG TPA: chemotaxis protein CheW [Polyangiaceae bacterium]|nr:chemotaxis protein CheW [Polyangiaceae bacterium]